MAHPPVHPGWKRVVLCGGPNDGQELTIKGTRNMVVTGVTDDGEVDPHSVERGAVYVKNEYGERTAEGLEKFDFLGHRTTEEIRQMLRGGLLSTQHDDCDPWASDPDAWKKGT